ncbi:MAG: amidase [Rhodospirillaceae bacterium]|jgi:aspartyl-tRNA(Asn)/glutamyl-tRNA(Gln) amidotransferase subunit A|nr:amidase [Rhodospirillaceae bacterium]
MSLTDLSLTELANGIAKGDISSEETTQACIARIERMQPALNCFLSPEPEDALAAARKADDVGAQARAKGEKLGPLHGVPLAHKDMFYRKGKVCTGGTIIRRDFVPSYTSTLQSRLAKDGALCLGTLNMSEFCIGPTGHNLHYGPARNPWNTAHAPGGSSSGSGSAVAARLIHGSFGSDTGGSVRIPAALNGLVGLKPTQGRISRYGGVPLSFSLDCFGPLTRTVEDNARLLSSVAGTDPMDPTTSLEPLDDYEAACGQDPKGMRIGVPKSYGDVKVDDDVAAAVSAALKLYEGLGVEIVEVDVPDQAELNALSTIVTRSEAATIHRKWLLERRDDYSPQVRRRLEIGLVLPATRYVEGLTLRAYHLAEFGDAVLSKCDALLLPTVPIPAPTLAELDIGDSDTLPEMLLRLTGFTRPMNYLGVPSLSMPCGFSGSGLPVAFQLVGRPFAEATLYTLGGAYQHQTDWHTRSPE